MSELQIHFEDGDSQHSTYRLLELPPELLALLQSNNEAREQICIKGRHDDDAVLCTPDKTYSIRSVTLSNAIYVLSAPRPNESGNAVIRDCVHEILEVTPAAPKIHRLAAILRGYEYDERAEDEDEDEGSGDEGRMKQKKRGITYGELKDEIQCSDAELQKALADKWVLNLRGHFRPITSAYLCTVLQLLLNTIVSMALSPQRVPAIDLAEALQCEHEVRKEVVMQVMAWFGEFTDQTVWQMDVDKIVKHVGIGLLSGHKDQPIAEDDLLQKWKTVVGDVFEDIAKISLLKGNYIISVQKHTKAQELVFFPASALPANPQERFAELFLTRPRWTLEDISPFLQDITLNAKERDRLIMKFTRTTTEKDGTVWYTARSGIVI